MPICILARMTGGCSEYGQLTVSGENVDRSFSWRDEHKTVNISINSCHSYFRWAAQQCNNKNWIELLNRMLASNSTLSDSRLHALVWPRSVEYDADDDCDIKALKEQKQGLISFISTKNHACETLNRNTLANQSPKANRRILVSIYLNRLQRRKSKASPE